MMPRKSNQCASVTSHMTKTKDGEAEVFVLPPGLLQKLGINLNVIGSTEECPTVVTSKADLSPVRIPVCSSYNSIALNRPVNQTKSVTDETILETADLMTKSVFLSPTFVGATDFTYSGELEIANTVRPQHLISNGFHPFGENNNISDPFDIDKMPFIIHQPPCEYSEIQSNYGSDNMNLTVSNTTSPSQDQDLITLEDILGESTKLKPIEDHPDEAYLSDCSNSNSGSLNSIAETHSLPIQRDHSKKIKILSEEIINPSQFENTTEMLYPKDSTFINVSANPVINSNRYIKNLQYNLINNNANLGNLVQPLNTGIALLFDKDDNKTLTSVDNKYLDVRDMSTDSAADGVKIECILPDPGLKTCTSDNSLNVCLDFVVNDIDMHLKDEDTELNLENFINDITSSDSDKIIRKIEESERESPIKKCRVADTNTIPKIIFDPVVVDNINCTNLISTCKNTVMKQNTEISNTSQVKEQFVDQERYNGTNVDAENTDNRADKLKNIDLYHANSIEVATEYMDVKLSETYVWKEQLFSEFSSQIEKNEIVDNNIKCYDSVKATKFEVTEKVSEVINIQRNGESDINILKEEVHSGINTTCENKELSEEDNKFLNETSEPTEKVKVLATNRVTSSDYSETGEEFETHKFNSVENNRTGDSVMESKMITYEDKVKEIAMVLMQFAKTHSNFSLKRSEPMKIPKIPAGQTNPLKLKKHVQGVEKPGGSVETCELGTTSKIIKTYGKSNKYKILPFMECMADTPKNQMHSDLTELDAVMNDNPEDFVKRLEFCLCGDFGKMTYYDSKIPYMHIHFWEQKIIDCDRENAFSIYNNSESFNAIEENMHIMLDLDLISDDNSKSLLHSICWHSFNKNEPSDTNLNESDVIEHVSKDTFCGLCGKAPQLNKVKNITMNVTTCDVKKVQPNSAEIQKPDAVEQTGKKVLSAICTDKMHNANKEETKASLVVASTLASCSIDVVGESSSGIKNIINELINQNQQNIANIEECHKNNISKEPVKPNDQGGKKKETVCENSTKSSYITVMDVELNTENTSELITANEINRESSGSHISRRRPAEAGNEDNNTNKKKRLIAPKDIDKMESADNTATLRGEVNPSAIEPTMTETSHDSKPIKHGLAQRKSLATNRKTIDEAVIQKDMEPPNKKSTKCGVCDLVMSEQEWEDHISQKHCFIAWKSGAALNFEDPILLESLQSRIKEKNFLRCSFCGHQNKNAANFLQHARQCVSKFENTTKQLYDIKTNQGGQKPNASSNVVFEVKKEKINEDIPNEDISSNNSVQCGVCNEQVHTSEWMVHIALKHQYMAWKFGDTPVDLANEEAIRFHLKAVVKETGELKCLKCGVRRKKAIKYLQHVRNCKHGLDPNTSSMDISRNAKRSKGSARAGCSVPFVQLKKCGVCKQDINAVEWINHIAQNHDYLAWQDGESPLNLDDENDVRVHLMAVLKEIGQLTCSKCGLVRKYAKKFNDHRKICIGVEGSSLSHDASTDSHDVPTDITMDVEVARNDIPNIKSSVTTPELNNVTNTASNAEAHEMVTCGVCKEKVKDWIGHIAEKHNYIAWKEGESAINPEDTFTVQRHLNDLSKEINGLFCHKCGFKRKYAIPFLQHVAHCTGKKAADQIGVPCTGNSKSIVKCAVCQAEVNPDMWTNHIFDQHQYMAWKEGESLDLSNLEEVEQHLTQILKQHFYLQCYKCCSLHKDVSSYLKHVQDCKALAQDNKKNKKNLTCALCWKELDESKWSKHRMEEHYNVAWYVGGAPVNIKSPNAIIQWMEEYKTQYKQLTCKLCGVSRASAIGFYAHVVACQKTEQEIDRYKNVCELCDKKYFYFYHSQHMSWHAQRGVKADIDEELEKKKDVKVEVVIDGRGGRRAAQKARNIIQKFKDEHLYQYKCPACEFGADTNEELKQHNCKGVKEEDYSDSDVSCKPEDESEESEDSDVDSNVSAEENEHTEIEDGDRLTPKTPPVRRRDHVSAASLLPRFPLRSTSKSIIANCGLEFHKYHFVCENLFPELRSFNCKPIPNKVLSKYLPLLDESCKVQWMPDCWETLKRFEARKIKLTGKNAKSTEQQLLFAGGYIQCISWAPSYGDSCEGSGQYLAVAGHCDIDQPRFDVADICTDPGLIQIWNFGDFKTPAEFVFGIAHDFGYIWAVDWCPSGARDSLPKDAARHDTKRLGLLSVACGNGSAYVFSVPYPAMVTRENRKVYRLEPVIELRLTMSSERTSYPATSISWTKQTGHQFIVVGYSDGTTAYYDLNTESPFLKTEENNRLVLFPYHDERLHNSCVTGVDTYPSLQEENLAGALCTSSVTGSCLMARPGLRPAKQQLYSAIGDTQFQPFWPSSLIVGDEGNLSTSLNEVEWWGGGRRFGGGSAAAGCWWCGQTVLAATPLLRVCYTHPSHMLQKGVRARETFGVLRMKQLSGKKRKLKNDDFQMKIEPTTYEEAIVKYGLELRFDQEIIDQTSRMSRESFPEKTPERWPLCEVTSMAFCPAEIHHKKLAIATHAGLIFLINVRI